MVSPILRRSPDDGKSPREPVNRCVREPRTLNFSDPPTRVRLAPTPQAAEADALSRLDAVYAALYRTEDFLEGRRAEAEGRPPRYQGK